MKIRKRTLLSKVQFMVQTERFYDEFMKQVPVRELKRPFGAWTCGDFIRIVNGEERFIQKKIIGVSIFALKYYGRVKAFENIMKAVKKFMSLNDTQPTDEERMAAGKCTFPSLQEQILLKVQQRFGLKSFREAEDVPLTSYLLICKEESANLKFNKVLQSIYEHKRKIK